MIDKEMVLANVSIDDACNLNGITIKHRNQILCPGHLVHMGKRNTNYGNCLIYRDSNTFKCHSCGDGGDVITLTMDAQNCSFKEALQFLAENLVPAAISNDYSGSLLRNPKRCPLSVNELRLIGLSKSTAINSIMEAESVYSAKHPDDDDPWRDFQFSKISSSESIGNAYCGDTLLCKTVVYSPLDLYRDDPVAFWEMVNGKANEAIGFCQRTRKMLDKRCKNKNGKAAIFYEYLKEKKEAADHAISLYQKTVLQQ